MKPTYFSLTVTESGGRQQKLPFLTGGPAQIPSRASGPTGSTLGSLGRLIFWGGTAALAISLGIISFLWITAHHAMEGKTVPETWRVIITSGWLSQSITLSALVLRLAIALQGGLVASMIAGPSGFSGLFWSLLTQPDTGSKRITTSVCLALVTILVVTASNFASTILLSDLGPGWYPEAIKATPAGVDTSVYAMAGSGRSYVRSNLDVFPTFGEYSESPLCSIRPSGILEHRYERSRRFFRNKGADCTTIPVNLSLWTRELYVSIPVMP
ncbi:hypothetical protein V8F06_012924 [Rhypophila decipiens]